MKLTKPSTAGNSIIGMGLTFRRFGIYLAILTIGLVLWTSPIFRGNWFAIIGYIAAGSIVAGETPTGRSMLGTAYGVVFKKPLKMVITDVTTVETIGHGIREVYNDPDVDAPLFKLHTGNVACVYTIMSGLNQWSESDDYVDQQVKLKALYNIFEEGESLLIVTKKDNDTGMLQLKDALDDYEDFEGDDLYQMSQRRKQLLTIAATSSVSRSVQQYAILIVKPRNIHRTRKALRQACRVIRPATKPADVLLAAMGFEGGVNCE